MTRELVVVGVRGFGRKVLDVVDAINASEGEVWIVRGVVDDSPTALNLQRLSARQVPYLGTVAALLDSDNPCHYIVGIGSPRIRRFVAAQMDDRGFVAATLTHPSASTGVNVRLGKGAVFRAGVRLTTNIRVGSHAHLNLNSTVGHDSVLGDFVSVNPLASISGDCVIEDEVLIGVAGVVLNGVTGGAGSTVGGSACVVKDVAAGVVVKGVPAR